MPTTSERRRPIALGPVRMATGPSDWLVPFLSVRYRSLLNLLQAFT